jgi:hypothetical protein
MLLDGQFAAPMRMMNKITMRLNNLMELERNSSINNLSKLLQILTETTE